MAWLIRIDGAAQKDLEKMDRQSAKRITAFLRERVSVLDNPRSIGGLLKKQPGQTLALPRGRLPDHLRNQ